MTKLCIDYDYALYAVGSKGETRSIKAVHKQSGDEYEFSTRTAFYGHHKKKAGGWLAEYNAAKSEGNRRSPDEFDIIDVQTPEPIQNCISTMKSVIAGVKEATGASSYYGYTGKGKTFREDVATVVGYKANRIGALRPLHLEDLRGYLIKYHACKIVTEIEADDACTIDSWDAWKLWLKSKSDKDKLVLAAVDKDAKGTTCHLYNPNKPELGVDSHDGFGGLWLDAKGDVEGRGRMWLYFQVMNGDDVDNYYANSANLAMKWAEKSAYNVLKDAKTDQEALQALVKGYKTLYPSPKKIIGWRGYNNPKEMTVLKPNAQDFEIEIDWFYMLNENFQLAKMLRWKGDKVDVKHTLDRLGVDY